MLIGYSGSLTDVHAKKFLKVLEEKEDALDAEAKVTRVNLWLCKIETVYA